MRAKELILASAKGAILAAVICGCATASPRSPPTCTAVLSAASTQPPGTSSTVSYYAINELADHQVTFRGAACDHGDDARMVAFCDAVSGDESDEFARTFGYDVLNCVQIHGRLGNIGIGNSHPSGSRGASGRSLASMNGQIGPTSLMLRERDGGFTLTFQRETNP
ncbi:MAG: hypothetical protein NT015_10355 [Alphaproteobacteria bacterium]|nr:hypothetical protein [Alphaproteobacteria bacterium]